MSAININVDNQRMMRVSSNYKIVSGSQKFVRLHFTLDADWENLTVFAQFAQDGYAYNQYLDENYDAFLPSEIDVGEFRVSLYGTGDSVIGTSNCLIFNVEKSEFIADTNSTEIEPSLHSQMIAELELKVNQSIDSPNGASGQVLHTNGDGTTEWAAIEMPVDQQANKVIFDWLAAHPEATTTVADGSIGISKLASELQDYLDNITNRITITDDDDGNVFFSIDQGQTEDIAVLDAAILDLAVLA